MTTETKTPGEILLESGVLEQKCIGCYGDELLMRNSEGDKPCIHCRNEKNEPTGYRYWQLRRECLCIEAVKTIAHGGESGYSIVCNRCALNIEHGGWCNCQGRGYNLPPDTELTGVLMEILGVDYSVTVWSLKGEWFVSLGGTFPFYRGPTLNHALAQAALPQN